MDFGEARNTFFDEYDTYLKSELVTIDHSALVQQHDNYVFLFNLFSCCNALTDKAENIKHQSAS